MNPQVFTTHEIGALVRRRHLVPLRPQLREDVLGIHQRLRAAEADEADAGGGLGFAGAGHGRESIDLSQPLWSRRPGLTSHQVTEYGYSPTGDRHDMTRP